MELAGHDPIVHRLATGDRKLSFTLAPSAFLVRINTEPAGADVFLDGTRIGESPIGNLEVPANGSHALRVRMDGYEDATLMFDRATALPDPIRLARLAAPPTPAPQKEPEKQTASVAKRSESRKTPARPPAPARKPAPTAEPTAAPEHASAETGVPPEQAGEAAEGKPGFWGGVGKGFREIGQGFKRFGTDVGDAFKGIGEEE